MRRLTISFFGYIILFLILYSVISGIWYFSTYQTNDTNIAIPPYDTDFMVEFNEDIFNGNRDYILNIETNFVVILTIRILLLNGSTIEFLDGTLGNPNNFLINSTINTKDRLGSEISVDKSFGQPFALRISVRYNFLEIFEGNDFRYDEPVLHKQFSTNFQGEIKRLMQMLIFLIIVLLIIEIFWDLIKKRRWNDIQKSALRYIIWHKLDDNPAIAFSLLLPIFTSRYHEPIQISDMISSGNYLPDFSSLEFQIGYALFIAMITHNMLSLNLDEIKIVWTYPIDRGWYYSSHMISIIVIILISILSYSISLVLFRYWLIYNIAIEFTTILIFVLLLFSIGILMSFTGFFLNIFLRNKEIGYVLMIILSIYFFSITNFNQEIIRNDTKSVIFWIITIVSGSFFFYLSSKKLIQQYEVTR
jgi:hypothetical protein